MDEGGCEGLEPGEEYGDLRESPDVSSAAASRRGSSRLLALICDSLEEPSRFMPVDGDVPQ
jgi:hypothetical protein